MGSISCFFSLLLICILLVVSVSLRCVTHILVKLGMCVSLLTRSPCRMRDVLYWEINVSGGCHLNRHGAIGSGIVESCCI